LPEHREIVGIVLQTAVSLAGLLLVFVGFVYSRAESYATKRGDLYKNVARAGFIPFGLSLLCAWISLAYLEGGTSEYLMALVMFKVTLIATGLFAFVVLFMYL
jgi:hypothetical protein